MTDPDRLAALEEERRFLLRSLSDLEREHAVGDIDDADYETLRDDYTVRAADTLRAIRAGRDQLPARRPTNWRRRAVIAVAAIGAFALIWFALSASSAQRLPGQTATGLDPRDDRQVILSQARTIQMSEPEQAAELYEQLIEADPGDVEALTYRGWTLALASRRTDDSDRAVELLTGGVQSLAAAIEADPTYPDPYCFMGIISYRFLDRAELAQPHLRNCLGNNPPAEIKALVEPLAAEVGAALGG